VIAVDSRKDLMIVNSREGEMLAIVIEKKRLSHTHRVTRKSIGTYSTIDLAL